MADYSFISNNKQSEPLQNIQGIVNTARGIQDYQRGAVELEKARELLQPQIRQGKAAADTAEVGTRQQVFKLNTDQAKYAMEQFGGLLGDERIKKGDPIGSVDAVNEVRDRLIEQGVPRNQADWQASQLISKAHVPGAIPNMINNLIRGAAGSANQAAVINAPVSAVGTGANTQFVQTQPNAPGGQQPGSTIANTVPPTQAETTKTDALGNPYIETKSPTGEIGAKPAPGSNTPPLLQLPPGESADTAKPLMAVRQRTNEAAAQVPSQRFNNAQIIKLAPGSFTGTGSDRLTKILGAVGIQSTNDVAADTAQLNHYIALQTENNAKAMGANTDAARGIAAQISGSAGSPEKAIIGIAKVNDAYATGLDLFNRGMEAAINNPQNNKSIFAARDFQNAWTQAFDPQAMLLHNALEARNNAPDAKSKFEAQKDIDELVKSVGGKGSAGAQKLAQKYKQIEKLATEGRP